MILCDLFHRKMDQVVDGVKLKEPETTGYRESEMIKKGIPVSRWPVIRD